MSVLADRRATDRRPARLRGAAALLLVALATGACRVEPGELPGQLRPLAVPAAPAPTPAFGLLSGPGVTDEPCPEAVNPDNGCIYLGALVDLSGPFAERGRAALDGATAFWRHVNEAGGVNHKPDDGIEARFDVNVTEHAVDNEHDVEVHLEAYREIEPDILALALSMGTPTTYEAMRTYKEHDVVAAPVSAWSGWAFEPVVAESGASYCFQAIDGMDWALDRLGGGTPIDHVVVVHHADLYGQDALAGVEYWVDSPRRGEAKRVPFSPFEHAVEVEPDVGVDHAIDVIVEVAPEVVVIATSPDELADIATGTAERDWHGLLIGMAPTFVPSLLDDPEVAEILESRYFRMGTVGLIGQNGEAYRDMRAALGWVHDGHIVPQEGQVPANDAWVAGWVSQYPLQIAIKDAVAAGDVTRAGVVHEVEEITVKYGGALPWTSYRGDPNQTVNRRTFVFRPDREALMGQTLVHGSYVGDTADQKRFARPCTEE